MPSSYSQKVYSTQKVEPS